MQMREHLPIAHPRKEALVLLGQVQAALGNLHDHRQRRHTGLFWSYMLVQSIQKLQDTKSKWRWFESSCFWPGASVPGCGYTGGSVQ